MGSSDMTGQPIRVVTDDCAAYLLSSSGNTTTGMLRQKGKSGQGAALSAVSENPDASAVLVNGVERARGTVKVAHAGYPDGSDASAAAVSIDLQVEGTAAQGIFVTATDGATTGNLMLLRNNAVDDFVVKGSGRVGMGVGTGMTPAGTVEVVQRDTEVPAIVVTTGARQGTVVEVTDGSGHRLFGLDASGNVTVTEVTIASSADAEAASGHLFVGADGWLKFRGAQGTVTNVAPP